MDDVHDDNARDADSSKVNLISHNAMQYTCSYLISWNRNSFRSVQLHEGDGEGGDDTEVEGGADDGDVTTQGRRKRRKYRTREVVSETTVGDDEVRSLPPLLPSASLLK